MRRGSSSTNTPTSATPSGTASRTRRACCSLAARGLCGQNTTPIMSAPAATAAAASSARVTPQILTTVTRSPHERRQEVGVAHESRADEQRVGTGIAHGAGVVGCLDARLRDPQEALRKPPQQLDLAPPVDLERRQVPRVDADDRRAEVERALQLRAAVHLDDGFHLEILGGLDEVGREVVLDESEQNEDRVGAVHARLGDLPDV